MAAFIKFNSFLEYLAEKIIDCQNDTFKVYLTNTTPVATHAVKADLAEISAGNGYTAGGNTASVSASSQSSGTFKLTLNDPALWTASGGTIGPFRYAVLYDDTPSGAVVDPLVGAWDYSASITLQVGETFLADLDAAGGVFTIT